MNLLYMVLIAQIILFLIGVIYAIGQTKKKRNNMPLPLAVRLILSFFFNSKCNLDMVTRSISRL